MSKAADIRLVVQAMANHLPEYSEYSGYYGCQFCGNKRRHTGLPTEERILRTWVTHQMDCPIWIARRLVEGGKI